MNVFRPLSKGASESSSSYDSLPPIEPASDSSSGSTDEDAVTSSEEPSGFRRSSASKLQVISTIDGVCTTTNCECFPTNGKKKVSFGTIRIRLYNIILGTPSPENLECPDQTQWTSTDFLQYLIFYSPHHISYSNRRPPRHQRRASHNHWLELCRTERDKNTNFSCIWDFLSISTTADNSENANVFLYATTHFTESSGDDGWDYAQSHGRSQTGSLSSSWNVPEASLWKVWDCLSKSETEAGETIRTSKVIKQYTNALSLLGACDSPSECVCFLCSQLQDLG
jgi:hypothetical protein